MWWKNIFERKEEEKDLRKELEQYEGYYKDILHTGSRVICDPAPKDTDDDYLLLSWEGAVGALREKLIADKFEVGGSGSRYGNHPEEIIVQDWSEGFEGIDYNRVFRSFKKDDVNIIVTIDPAYFKKFSLATGIAKKLNLLKKEDRVALFETMVRDVQHPLEKPFGLAGYYKEDFDIRAGGINRADIPANWVWHNGVAGRDVIMNNEALVNHLDNAPINVVDRLGPEDVVEFRNVNIMVN